MSQEMCEINRRIIFQTRYFEIAVLSNIITARILNCNHLFQKSSELSFNPDYEREKFSKISC